MELTPALINKALGSASKGDKTTLETLLSKKIDLSRCMDRYGATIVHYAARAGKLDLIRWLVLAVGLSGSKQANNGATPVHDAAATGQLECLQWLVKHGGCSSICRDASLATPLHLAARFNKVAVVVWLVESEGCDPMERAKGGITPLHLAAARGSTETIRWLTQYSQNAVDKRADNGATPLYFSAQEGQLESLKFLATQADANCRLRASDGMAPIHAAAQMGRLDCLVWLVEHQKIPIMERDNDGATPLHYAAARGHINVLQWLLNQGATMEQDDLGGTPLHDAAEHGQMEAVKLLVGMHADPHIRDSDQLTPADLAEDGGFYECAEYLKKQPPNPVIEVEINLSSNKEPFSASLVHSAIEVTKQSKNRYSPPIPSRPLKNSATETAMKSTEQKLAFQLKRSETSSTTTDQVREEDISELSSMFKKIQNRPKPVDERSYDNDSDESSDTNLKTQNPQLMEEVRLFDRDILENTPLMKRNLQPFKVGKVLDDESSPKHAQRESLQYLNNRQLPNNQSNFPTKPKTTPTSQLPPYSTPQSLQNKMSHNNPPTISVNDNRDDDNESDDEDKAKIPLWKRQLLKKRQKEQEEEAKKEDKQHDDKWSDVPEWKRNILIKKEAERAKQRAIDEEKLREQTEKQAKFDALPDWKKKIIRKRSDLVTS